MEGHGLCTGHLPPLDLVVRTGKVMRLSNFMLFKSAYAELFFPDIYFPELTPGVLDGIAEAFSKRKRTYGK
jgi:undecaprenyl diphosphate synthase